jgi:hypothetical protein
MNDSVKTFLSSLQASLTRGERSRGASPPPVADEAPVAYVDYRGGPGSVGISFRARGEKREEARPPGQRGVEIGWVVSDVSVGRVDELRHSRAAARSPVTLSFGEDESGKVLYFALRWENTRGEKGPWGQIRGVIIP